MRFHIGPVPGDPESPTGTWKRLREPGPGLINLFALPIGAVACAVVVFGWLYLTPITKHPVSSPIQMILGLLLLFPIHELIHALIHPNQGRTSNSILGIWPSRMLLYAHYIGELSRTRFIAILAMPFLIISVLPLAVCAALGQASVTLAYVSGMNALVAGGDLFAVGLLLSQVPKAATVRNRGWRTYWINKPLRN